MTDTMSETKKVKMCSGAYNKLSLRIA